MLVIKYDIVVLFLLFEQVIPLHLPPGDTSTERTVQIDGTSEQIESAKQLVNEVISEVCIVVMSAYRIGLFYFLANIVLYSLFN